MRDVRYSMRRLGVCLAALLLLAVSVYPLSAGTPASIARSPDTALVTLLNRPTEANWATRLVTNSGARHAFASAEVNSGAAFTDEVPPLTAGRYSPSVEQPAGSGWRTLFGPWPGDYADPTIPEAVDGTVWVWQWLPEGLLYKSYLAGEKESRFASAWLYEFDDGWIWDITLGGRVPIARLGTTGSVAPEGWQLEVEGAAFPRLNLEKGQDLDSADFRFGLPITWARGRFEGKLGYYHISSHVGDEFLARNSSFQRINYVRDSIVLAVAYWLTPDVRLYAEAAYAFNVDGGAEPWEFQFGGEYSPADSGLTVLGGQPFVALNAHLFEEHDFGGSVNVLAGWQWRSSQSDRLLRLGLQYFGGKSSQYAFFDENQQLLGIGTWLDY